MLNLSTWNAPVAIGLVPAIGAIAAGNAVLLKPSELAPHSAKVLREIIASCFPPDEFAVVEGGPAVAQELLSLPFNAHLLHRRPACRPHRHEGRGRSFRFRNVGDGRQKPSHHRRQRRYRRERQAHRLGPPQQCRPSLLAPDYALVHRSKLDEFVAEYGKAATAMFNPTGAGFAASPEYPRLIGTAHFGRVKALIDDAVAKGADHRLRRRDGCRKPLHGADRADRRDRCNAHSARRDLRARSCPSCPGTIATRSSAPLRPGRNRWRSTSIRPTGRRSEEFLGRTSSGSTVVNHNMIQSGTNPLLPFGGANHSGIGRIGAIRASSNSPMPARSSKTRSTPAPCR